MIDLTASILIATLALAGIVAMCRRGAWSVPPWGWPDDPKRR